MPKEAFIAKHLDELVGLLLASFVQREKTNHLLPDAEWAKDGKFMMAQMRRAREMLGRMWDDLQQPKVK